MAHPEQTTAADDFPPGTADVLERLVRAPALDTRYLMDVLQPDQEIRWRRGERVPAEAYLHRFPALPPAGEDALDLVLNEVQLRAELGEHPTLAEFALRFPQFSDPLGDEFDLESHLRPADPDDAEPADDEPTVLETVAGTVLVPPWYREPVLLGRGGMGVVLRARDPQLGRVVALKLTLSPLVGDARLHGEGHAIARLQHPNIVQIFALGEYRGRAYLALEYVPGGSLHEKLHDRPRPAWGEAAGLVQTLALAVHYAHLMGVAHRDLKPANVLLTADGEPKITDFGLASVLDRHHEGDGDVVGTPAYLAPELVAPDRGNTGHTADGDKKVDVYSLGVILYELLTGRLPYAGADAAAVLAAIRSGPPAAPRSLSPAIPCDLEAICLKCLARDPDARYASAADLADDLARFGRREPVAARPVGLPRRVVMFGQRRPAVAALAVVSTFGLVAFAVNQYVQRVQADELRGRAEEGFRQSDVQRLRAETHLRTALESLNTKSAWLEARRAAPDPPIDEEELERTLAEDLKLYETLLDANRDNPAVARQVAVAHARLAIINRRLGRYARAVELNLSALDLQQGLAGEGVTDPGFRAEVARTWDRLALLYLDDRKQWSKADDAFDRAVAAWRDQPGDPRAADDLASTLGNRAVYYRRAGRLPDALRDLDEAVRLRRQPSPESDARGRRIVLAAALFNLGNVHADLAFGKGPAHPNRPLAEAAYRESLQLRRALYDERPRDPTARHHLAQNLISQGVWFRATERRPLVGPMYDEARTLLEELMREYPKYQPFAADLGLLRLNMGNLEGSAKEFEPAWATLVRGRRPPRRRPGQGRDPRRRPAQPRPGLPEDGRGPSPPGTSRRGRRTVRPGRRTHRRRPRPQRAADLPGARRGPGGRPRPGARDRGPAGARVVQVRFLPVQPRLPGGAHRVVRSPRHRHAGRAAERAGRRVSPPRDSGP
ncbi:MAG TPA: serine/threonine-protein kinase [Urbifossiella sp.]|nr:serine/threonine-protein kinase [Urbifossiella sp.]